MPETLQDDHTINLELIVMNALIKHNLKDCPEDIKEMLIKCQEVIGRNIYK